MRVSDRCDVFNLCNDINNRERFNEIAKGLKLKGYIIRKNESFVVPKF